MTKGHAFTRDGVQCLDCKRHIDDLRGDYECEVTAPDPARLHQSIRQLEGDGGRVDVEHLKRLLHEADVSGWTVAYDHKDGDDSSWDEVWIRGHYGETIAMCGERYTMAPQHAALIAAAVTQLPALLDLTRRQDAALTAVRELADDWLEGRTVIDGSKQMELIAAAALASPDTTQEADENGCPVEPHGGVDCPGDACRFAQ